MRNRKFNYNTRKKYLIGAGLVVGMSSTILSGVYLKDNAHLSNVASPIKELVLSKKNTKSVNVVNNVFKSQSTVSANTSARNNENRLYLSDIEYMPISSTAYDKIRYDNNLSGNFISLIVNGKKKLFRKGVFAHANATLAYDLTGYDYDYLTAYLGVDTEAGSKGNGVRFEIHTSEDGINWVLQDRINNNATFKGDGEAFFFKYPIKDVKYIKFVVQDNGKNNTSDHSVFADLKLIKEGYEEETDQVVSYIKTVAEYDKIIKTFDSKNLTREQELTLLQRNFVNNVGYDLLQILASPDSECSETISWLMNDLDNLKLYIMGGKPTGSYQSSLTQLTRLYNNYKDDFTIETSLNNKFDSSLTYGDLYKKMAITLSLTHSSEVRLWMHNTAVNKSDAVVRYAIYKYMHKTGRFKLNAKTDMTAMFESLPVETMRFVMNNSIDDESILWLNDYVQTRIDANNGNVGSYLTPHPYIKYVYPNYTNKVFYDEENIEYFNELFAVNDRNNPGQKIGLWDVTYTIPGGTESAEYTLKITRGSSNKVISKVWMNFRNKFGTGAVCGGISKSGSNIRATHGIPATVIGQPGHAALLYYSQNEAGKGYWSIDNDVSGWTKSEKGERMLLGWGNDKRYATSYTVPYMVMAQEALNRFDDYQKSVELLMIADTYANDTVKYEAYVRESLEALDFNVDAWYRLIELYNNDSTKTEEDYFNLLKELSDSLMKYPLAFYQLSAKLQPKFVTSLYKFKYQLLMTNTLTTGKSYTGTDILQPGVTRTMASYLLGKTDTSLATFSFDGENSGSIVLSSRFDGSGVRWDYSLDGKETWKEISFTGEEPHILQLTEEEIKKITSGNDIYIHIVGVNYSEENLYKIDILESVGLPTNLYANDLENKIMGITDEMEWRYRESDDWIKFSVAEPDLSGNKTVTVRVAPTGTRLPSSEATFTFTKDSENPKMKYIPTEHLSIKGFSTQSKDSKRPYYAQNAIDGNGTTLWHTDFAQNVLQQSIKPYITIEIDEAKNINGLEFMQIKYPGKPNDPDQIKNARVYVSTNGTDWILGGKVEDCTTYGDLYRIEFDQSVYGKYVKLEMDTYNMFASIAMINLYENTNVSLSASFALDGENANKIILHGDDLNFAWRYSLDGGNSWNDVTGAEYQLSNAEASKITEENGIIIRRNDVDVSYTINITKAPTLDRVYASDIENRLIGVTDPETLEWKYSEETEWKSYSKEEPIVKGDKVLQVRKKAAGTTLASDFIEYTFTVDTDTDNRKYISVKHLSVHSVSSEATAQGRYAKNIIDANPNTSWHSAWNGTDKTKELVIKLDQAKYINSLEFLPIAGGNGKIEQATILISMDGVNYTEVAETDWTYSGVNDVALRTINFEPTKGRYIKIVGKKTQAASSSLSFIAGAMINLYEDTTIEDATSQYLELQYNISTLTNQDVVVTVVSDHDFTITNNNGSKEYIFTENGSFEFEYVDADGDTGTILAVVDWIDKEVPVATISYSGMDVTNQDVVVTLSANKHIIVTNNDGKTTYTFTENGEFTFEYVDDAGNKGSETAFVSWINKNAPVGTVAYDKTSLTNQDVVATLTIPNGVTIINNNGLREYIFKNNGTFTFEFVDGSGNRGTATAEVNWIDKVEPIVNITYSTTSQTDKSVIATISADEVITITNNDGKTTYTFTENGEFTFEYVDRAGNKGSITAIVDWIKQFENRITFIFDHPTLTNQDVTAILVSERPISILNNNGSNTYVFTENGEFVFQYIDEYGNAGFANVVVDWIDKVELKVDVNYNITSVTAENVIATINSNKNIEITNNGGSNTYVFTENGEFTFEYVDPFGNAGTITATVDWIDKTAPTAIVRYSTEDPTNQNVTVKLLNPFEYLTITNNNGSDTYVFTENGDFVFEYVDEAGNKGSTYVKVTWIDRTSPTAGVEFSTTDKTNKDVTVTIKPNKDVTILNNGGSATYVFTENGEFTFEYVDKAGNIGTTEVKVDWIYKKTPLLYVEFDTENVTTGAVTATLVLRDGITITNNNGDKTHIFTRNGQFTFEYVDEYGNVGYTTAEVNWIRENTVVSLEYSTVEETTGSVSVTVNSNNKLVILNNNGSDTYTFTNNGVFTFQCQDEFGKVYYMSAAVNWIKEDIINPGDIEEPEIEIPSLNPDKNTNVVKPNTPSSPNNSTGQTTKPITVGAPTNSTSTSTTSTTISTKKPTTKTTSTTLSTKVVSESNSRKKTDIIAVIAGIVGAIIGVIILSLMKRKNKKKKKWDFNY